MKIRTLPALLMCLSFPIAALAAQPAHVVRGVIADRDSSEPIGYATASISRDSTVVTAVAAGLDGQFTLPVADKGSYRLNVAAVGYDPFTQEITVGGAVADLDTLRLRPGIEIEQVVVKAQKPLIVSDAEKMTYSVEDDPQASSSTLEEIIRKVPQLSLDADGNVLLNGQSDYKILLNGHQSGSLGSNFKDIIKSMPASQIKKIEVITNPSTKYDAEGVGGILNLVTEKKRAFDGYNGSVRTGTSLLNGFSYYGNANASVQIGKFAASLSAYYSHYENNDNPSTSESHQENFDSQTARFQDSYGKSTYGGNYFGATLDASFQPDTLNLVTLNASLWTGRNRNHDQTNLTVSDPQLDPLFGYLMHNRNRYRYIGGTVGMSYEHTFNRSEHTLTLSDEVEIDPDDYDDFTAFDAVLGPVPTGQFINEKTRKVNNTVQIDYINPLSEHHQIEAGAKHIYRYNRIMDTYQIEKAGQYVPDTEGPHAAMTYRQHIVALYAGYNLTFDKWAGRLGARMERTWNDANGEERDADTYSAVQCGSLRQPDLQTRRAAQPLALLHAADSAPQYRKALPRDRRQRSARHHLRQSRPRGRRIQFAQPAIQLFLDEIQPYVRTDQLLFQQLHELLVAGQRRGNHPHHADQRRAYPLLWIQRLGVAASVRKGKYLAELPGELLQV